MPPQHQQPAYRYDAKKILRDLEENNKFFDDLVDMIPAKLYVAGNTGDEMYNTKYGKGQHKESKEARRARNKASLSKKFDPNTAETTLQAQRRIREERDNELDSTDDDEDNEGDIVDDSDGEGQESHDIEMTDNDDDHKNEVQSRNPPSESTPRHQSRIETLRAKLRAKIAAKQPKRTDPPTHDADAPAALTSKRAARKAEKLKRIEIAKRKNAGGSTRTMANGKERGEGGGDGAGNLKEGDLGGSKILSLDSKASGDDLAGIDFGGIAGLKDGIGSNYTNANKSLKNMGKKKSLVGLLEKASANSEKLEKLKASDDLDDKARVKKVEWNKTLKAASGNRSKDDPAILKKAIKRRAKKKAKSQVGWKKRMEHVKGKMDDRQKIRQHNIGQRMLGGAAGANLSRKRIDDGDGGAEGGKENAGKDGAMNKRPRLGPHSGNARAGFEGKKQDFINKGGKSTGDAKKAK